MKIVHKHIVHMHNNRYELINRLNHAQKTGRFVTESTINGTKVTITQNDTLLTKIKMVKNEIAGVAISKYNLN